MKYQILIEIGEITGEDPLTLVCGAETCPWWTYEDKELKKEMCTLFGAAVKNGERCMDCRLATCSRHRGIWPCL